MPTGCPSRRSYTEWRTNSPDSTADLCAQLCLATGNENGPAKPHRSFNLDTQAPAALRAV